MSTEKVLNVAGAFLVEASSAVALAASAFRLVAKVMLFNSTEDIIFCNLNLQLPQLVPPLRLPQLQNPPKENSCMQHNQAPSSIPPTWVSLLKLSCRMAS